MRYLTIEKEIEIQDGVVDVCDLETKEELKYVQEGTNGIRALGSLRCKANVIYEDHVQEVNELYQLDVFAPRSKLEQDSFQMKLQKTTPMIEQHYLKMLFVFALEGMFDEEQEHHSENEILQEDHEIEELFDEDDERCLCYRMVIAQANDTYETLAQRYDVELEALKKANHNKEVKNKSVFVLPFLS